MAKRNQDILNSLQGWIQQCKRCGTAKPYDQHSIICERCGEGDLDIFYKCPECGTLTDYGRARCPVCKKEISYLPELPFHATGILPNVKKKKVLKYAIAFSAICGLLFAAYSSFFIVIPIILVVTIFALVL